MTPYQVSLKIDGKLCGVVGGGKVAQKRVEQLITHGARIRVVAPDLTSSLREYADSGRIEWHNGTYEPAQIDGAFLVIAATNNPAVNEDAGRYAQSKGILVCRADSPDDGDFIIPGTITRGDLAISVSTNGLSPTLTSVILGRIGADFGPEWESWTALFGNLRPALQAIPTQDARTDAAVRILASPDVIASIARGDIDHAEREAVACLS